MILSKFLIGAGLAVVIVKFVLSLLGKNNITWLNQLVAAILVLFIGFELFQLSMAVWGQLS
ncbi:MAG: hypothetical protein AB4058_11900 [Microcystaceae cyanobacterium]